MSTQPANPSLAPRRLGLLLLGLLASASLWACGADTPPAGDGDANNGGGANNDSANNGILNNGAANNGGGGVNNGAATNNDTGGNNGGGENNGGTPVDPLLPPQCVPSEEICDGLDNDCNGQVDEIACACLVETACYGGPAQTRGVGACLDGQRACDQSGEFFGPCEGWTGPVEEICLDGIDNDCDGLTDEGACREVCQSGETRPCYGGDPALAGVGICNQGQQVCGVEREWGACEGWGQPTTEICDNGLDDDCDGVEDIDCYDDLPDVEDSFEVDEITETQPVDFLMAVDNSGSMDDTVAQVEANLGSFAQRLVDSGIDYRFVLVAERGTDSREPDICIPPPMAGPNCSDSGRFIHINQYVHSHDAYQRLLQCYSGCGNNNRYSYRDFLRGDALKQMIVVTDDESNMAWTQFRDQMQTNIGDFVLNGVVGLQRGGCVASPGQRYIEGANETGGELLHICDNDWGQVIDVLFEATITRLLTNFTLSQVPIPETLMVFIRAPGLPDIQLSDGWHWDESTNKIVFDPNSRPENDQTVLVRYKPRP
jgi:hypothetical protein